MRMTALGRRDIDFAAEPPFENWTFSDKVPYVLDTEVAGKQEG